MSTVKQLVVVSHMIPLAAVVTVESTSTRVNSVFGSDGCTLSSPTVGFDAVKVVGVATAGASKILNGSYSV